MSVFRRYPHWPDRETWLFVLLFTLFGLLFGCGPAGGAPPGVYIPSSRHAQVSLVGDMLMGRVAGLEVRRTSRGHVYRIRGPRSLMGSQEPLLVLDGSPMPIGLLNTLNPRDIAQVYILRDVAFYGSRGVNGVLIVTTKR